jgi:hypothetical protein
LSDARVTEYWIAAFAAMTAVDYDQRRLYKIEARSAGHDSRAVVKRGIE